jgi:hypothetical protein
MSEKISQMTSGNPAQSSDQIPIARPGSPGSVLQVTAGSIVAALQAITSVFGRTGVIVPQSGDYSVAQVTGAAPLASPALTGNPTAPTQTPGDNSTKLATTAFVAAVAAVANAISLQGLSVSSVTPLPGDTLRYNEWGDNKWDVCLGSPFTRGWYSDLFNAQINAFNAGTNPVIGTGSALQRISATATEPASQKNLTSAVASTSVTCYIAWQSAGINPFSWGTIKRMSMRMMLLHTANVRYFWGWFANAATPAISTGTDTPAIHYAAFRYSATTDTTIKAICGTDATHLTIVDTGVAVDTANSHVFDIAFDGVNVNFFIDGVLKAQISTNLPSASDLVQPSLMCDNKNTANAVGWQFAWMVVTPK